MYYKSSYIAYMYVLKKKTLLNKDIRKADLDKFSFNWNLNIWKLSRINTRKWRNQL